MAGKQILQFYAVSVKKEVKRCKFKTEKQIEAVGEELHPEVCGDLFSRRSPWTSSFATVKDVLRRNRNPRCPLLTNTTQNHENILWALIFRGENCCIFCCCCLETPNWQSFPATFPSLPSCTSESHPQDWSWCYLFLHYYKVSSVEYKA